MRFLDTNVFVRYLTGDDERKAQASLALLRRLETGEEEATTCEAVIAEVVYVLVSRRHYGLSPSEVAERLRPVLSLRGLRLPHKRVYLRALDLYASHGFLDFEDALCLAHMQSQSIETIVSYDTDFDRVQGVSRVEP